MDGTKLREARERRGMSQRELAEKAGTHQTTISKIERTGHEPAPIVREGMARVLGVPVASLSGNGSAPPQRPQRSASGREQGRTPPARLAPRDDPRVVGMLAELRLGRRPAPPVPQRPTYYRCPYCDVHTHTEEDAVRHAVACDSEFPGYSEVRVRYVELSAIGVPAGRSLRDARKTRASAGGAR